MITDAINCVLCGCELKSVAPWQTVNMVVCSLCGNYAIAQPRNALDFFASTDQSFKVALSCATRQAAEVGRPLTITPENVHDLAAPHKNTSVGDNQNKLLRCIARKAPRPGSDFAFDVANDFTLIDCLNPTEFLQHLAWLENAKLIVGRTYSTKVHYGLTVEGWGQVQPLSRPGGVPGRCFVAMWFSDEMNLLYEVGIAAAVRRAGCDPILISQKEHNNEIPDEIWSEIRNCQFMVADFTGQRNGVYFEAGFAAGLGREVIWCCRKDEIGKLHFDTNHRNHIDWSTPEELAERLYNRIRKTILEKQ